MVSQYVYNLHNLWILYKVMPLRLFTAGITIVRLRWLIRYSGDSYDGNFSHLQAKEEAVNVTNLNSELV